MAKKGVTMVVDALIGSMLDNRRRMDPVNNEREGGGEGGGYC